MSIEPWQDEAVIRHSQHLLHSFKHWTANDFITSTGKRFEVQDGIIWNVLDQQHQHCGQAAVYSQYKFL